MRVPVPCANRSCRNAFGMTNPLVDGLPDGWIAINSNGMPDRVVCSPSCLVEFSWWLKENQTKLSKSKEQ